MKVLTAIFILTLATISRGQTAEQKKQHQEDYLKLVWDTNLPDDLYDFFKQENLKSIFEVNKDLNPFYLRGDFDGDKNVDKFHIFVL